MCDIDDLRFFILDRVWISVRSFMDRVLAVPVSKKIFKSFRLTIPITLDLGNFNFVNVAQVHVP